MICCECHSIIKLSQVAQTVKKPREVTLYICRQCFTKMMKEMQREFNLAEQAEAEADLQLSLW